MVAITALGRGGYSAYGASYDSRRNAVILPALSGEVNDLTITMPSAISSVTKELHGLDATNAVIADTSFTSRVNGIEAGGWLEFAVTLTSGEVRKLRVEASSSFAGSFDYGSAITAETEEALILE